jgi:hypothetical protein
MKKCTFCLPLLLVFLHHHFVLVKSFTLFQQNDIESVVVRPTTTTTARFSSSSFRDPFDPPESRWECPFHEDICSETGVTLSRYMMEMARVNPELEEIESSKFSFVHRLEMDRKVQTSVKYREAHCEITSPIQYLHLSRSHAKHSAIWFGLHHCQV